MSSASFKKTKGTVHEWVNDGTAASEDVEPFVLYTIDTSGKAYTPLDIKS